MPHYIDVVFPDPIGRIHRASGATTARQNRERNDFLRRLYFKLERHDLVLAYHRQEIGLVELIDADRRGALAGTIGDLALRRPLWTAIDDTLPRMGRTATTRKRYEVSFHRLKGLGALDEKATVADLGDVPWRELSADWETSPSDWMHLYRAVSHFLSVILGDVLHPGRRAIMKKIPRMAETEREPDVPVELFLKIVAELPTWLQPDFMTLAICGLRVGEYLDLDASRLHAHTFGVQVVGRTVKKRTRVVKVDPDLWPYVVAGVPSKFRYKAMREHWVTACTAAGVVAGLEGVTMHDLRHCRAQWSHDAGSSLSALQAMLGHQTIAMTGRYAKRKMKTEDAAAFGRILAPHLKTKAAQ